MGLTTQAAFATLGCGCGCGFLYAQKLRVSSLMIGFFGVAVAAASTTPGVHGRPLPTQAVMMAICSAGSFCLGGIWWSSSA
jgi:hypothetical protein